AGFFPEASAITLGPPTAISEAILPVGSTRIAEGVPVAPNLRPVAKPSSITVVEVSPIALLASTVPVDTRMTSGAPAGLSFSQALRSSVIFLQKPQPGFQKTRSV